jgi:hypothetical protein
MYGGRNDLENLTIGRRKLDALASKSLSYSNKLWLAKETKIVSLATSIQSENYPSIDEKPFGKKIEKNPKSIMAHLRASQSVIHFGCACTGLAGGF